jgi:hypothetical protein
MLEFCRDTIVHVGSTTIYYLPAYLGSGEIDRVNVVPTHTLGEKGRQQLAMSEALGSVKRHLTAFARIDIHRL